MAQFKILCLDGGGIKGTFTAAVLAELETMTGKSLVDYFDLIVGTSTGGIIALGMGLELSPQKILDFYISKGPKIFPCTGLARKVRWMFRSKHCQNGLKTELENIFGDKILGDVKCRLVVPSYDADRGDVHLFKTSHLPRLKQDWRRPVVEVAVATASAPTYFPAFRSKDGMSFVDGGVWANCPVMVGLTEALTLLDQQLPQISILSIGTTSSPFHISDNKQKKGGLLFWNKGIIDLCFQAQTRGILAQAGLLCGGRLLRLDQVVANSRFSLDDTNGIEGLVSLGKATARHGEKQVSELFLQQKSSVFNPYNKAA